MDRRRKRRKLDPLPGLIKMDLLEAKKVTQSQYFMAPPRIPHMTPEMMRKCMADLRLMEKGIRPWKMLDNGMAAGEFAYIYLKHFFHK